MPEYRLIMSRVQLGEVAVSEKDMDSAVSSGLDQMNDPEGDWRVDSVILEDGEVFDVAGHCEICGKLLLDGMIMHSDGDNLVCGSCGVQNLLGYCQTCGQPVARGQDAVKNNEVITMCSNCPF